MRILSIIFFSFLISFIPLSAQDELDSLLLYSSSEEVVVTGQFAPIAKSYSINTVEVIGKDYINRRSVLNLEELLQQHLNVRITQDAVLGGKIQMQGMQGAYIKIMVDGVPLIGRNDGDIDLSRINLQNVEKIEIVEGPMSIAYGTNALGGTINIITKKYQNSDIEAEFSSLAESVGRYNLRSAFGAKWKNFTLRADGAYNYFNGFSTDTLRSNLWNPKEQFTLDAFLRWDPSPKWHLKYNFRLLDEQIDNLGNLRLGNFPELAYANDNIFLTNTMDHQISYTAMPTEKYYLEGFLAHNLFKREKNVYNVALLENQAGDFLDSLNSDTTLFSALHFRTAISSDFGNKIDFQIGADLRHEQGWGERISLPDSIRAASIGDYALFANLRYSPLKNLMIQAGLRYSYNTRYQTPLTYSFQMRWNFEKYYTFRLSYARGFRAPELKELFLDFVDSNHFIKGNPDLKAELSHNIRIQMGYERKLSDKSQLTVNCSGFYNFINNQIDLRQYVSDSSGRFNIAEQNTNQFAYFNIEEFQSLGSDLRVNYQFGNFSFSGGFVLTGVSNILYKDFNELAPFLFTLEFNQEINCNFPKYGWNLSLFRKDLDKVVRFVSSFNPISREEEITQTEMQGYTLMDLTISKSFFKKSLRISGGIRNLMNVINVAGGESSGGHSSGNMATVGMGRTYFIQLNYNIGHPKK